MAVSMLPLVLAASLRLVRGRLSVGPVARLVAASAVFSGSHNVTLLWGSTSFWVRRLRGGYRVLHRQRQ